MDNLKNKSFDNKNLENSSTVAIDLDNIRTITINGVELEYDIFDLEFNEKYDDGLALIREEAISKDNSKKMSEIIRMQCNLIFDFFDDLFGEGVSEDIFGQKTNLMSCLRAFQTLNDAIEKQVDETKPFLDEIKGKNNKVLDDKNLNREQRRSKKK